MLVVCLGCKYFDLRRVLLFSLIVPASDVDPTMYGNIPVGQMVFDIGGDGKATAVDLRAFRVTLERES
jgi:hypothetical protein